MAKKEIILQEEIDRINSIMKNAKLIREGLYFEDDDYPGESDAYDDSEIPAEDGEMGAGMEQEDPTKSLGSEFVDKIRAITLDGMKQLNDTPNDPRFQALLKIFNICNKAVDDQKEGNNPQQPQQHA